MTDLSPTNAHLIPALSQAKAIIQLRGLSKVFEIGKNRLEVLRGIDLEIAEGEAVAIVGGSGAGKSTLLHMIGTLDRPTLGKQFFRGRDVSKFSDDELSRLRNHSMGFVFQFHHLLAEFSALENAAMPCLIAGVPQAEALDRARRLLIDLGLSERLDHFPNELSGGEQQRVAIARALIQNPDLVLADEPTGNLDSVNGRYIQDLLLELCRQRKTTLIVVTHDLQFASRFQRVLRLADGTWAAF